MHPLFPRADWCGPPEPYRRILCPCCIWPPVGHTFLGGQCFLFKRAKIDSLFERAKRAWGHCLLFFTRNCHLSWRRIDLGTFWRQGNDLCRGHELLKWISQSQASGPRFAHCDLQAQSRIYPYSCEVLAQAYQILCPKAVSLLST